jgi:hypothetical protein
MIISLALLALAASPQQPPIENPCANGYTQNVWDPRYTPGQRWSYRNRPIDQGSTLVITKIDDVPGIGLLIQINVDHIDLVDDPACPKQNCHDNVERLSMAFRRDSLDASTLQMLEIVQTVGPPAHEYQLWQSNCGGLTYGSTVADAIQSEHEAYIARYRTLEITIAPIRIASGKHEMFKLSLTAPAQSWPRQHNTPAAIVGSLTTKTGTSIKDAVIELQLREINPAQGVVDLPKPITIKTATDGSFHLPNLSPVNAYTFSLTLDGFRTMTGTLRAPSDRPSLQFINEH